MRSCEQSDSPGMDKMQILTEDWTTYFVCGGAGNRGVLRSGIVRRGRSESDNWGKVLGWRGRRPDGSSYR